MMIRPKPFQVSNTNPALLETGKRIDLLALTRPKTDFGYRIVQILFCNPIILKQNRKEIRTNDHRVPNRYATLQRLRIVCRRLSERRSGDVRAGKPQWLFSGRPRTFG
jgi:hypothetical protein